MISPEKDIATFSEGDVIINKIRGDGIVTEVSGNILTVRFEYVGEKLMSAEWVKKNCILKS